MTKTENYKLTQWEKSDRIQMEDFNADNANLEAALTALSAETAGFAAELAKKGLASDVASLKSKKLQFDTLLSKSVTLSGSTYSLDIPGDEMGECVIAAITLSGSNVRGVGSINVNSASYGLHMNPGSSSYVNGILDFNAGYTTIGVFFPLKTPDLDVQGVGFSEHMTPHFACGSVPYNQMKSLYFVARSGSTLSGTLKIRIYGVR